jgi:predicted RNA binding protein YcfA (HicA-like mRNA interferase family)
VPKLYSSKEVIAGLERAGFAFVSRRGSHIKYRIAGPETRTVIVPADRKEIPEA